MKLWRYLLRDRNLLCLAIITRVPWLFPDKLYLKMLFRLRMGYPLNVDTPQTYTEKLQWLKLYDRRPEYTHMVDKYEVKKYVANLIGEQYIIPTIGVWDRIEDIDFDSLPNQFVLKTTHGGGNTGVVICKNKETFDIYACKNKLRKSLRKDIYKDYREWPYKNVKPRIIAEQFMTDSNGELNDIKFFCFDGVPKAMLIATDRNTNVHFDYYDMDFNHFPFEQGGPNATKPICKPLNMDVMKSLAEKLSQNIPHVRVDFYNVDGKIYFGELTFFDSSGFAQFNPEEWDYIFGSWINLPEKTI